MKRTLCTTGVLMAASLALALCERVSTAQTPTPAPLPIQQVALFKNGLGFFVGQFECPADQASFQVALPVAPSHGTFWVSYPAEFPLAGVVAKQVESGQTLEATTVAELLKANVGKHVQLTIGDKEITGVIKYVAQSRQAPRPDPYLPGGTAPYADYEQPWGPHLASLLTLATDTGEVSLDPATVSRVTFLEGPAERRFTAPGKSAVLQVQLKNPAPGQKLTVSFLAKGITWAPSYMVDISDGAKAKLSAKALILNDACELKDTAAQLVTGFPHLLFSDIVSPVALKADLARFLQALSQGQSERGRPDIMSNVMSQRVQYAPMPTEGIMPAYSAAEAGQVAEDLFLYPAGPVTLAKNEVAYIPLFTEAVPYQHIYQWDIPDYVNEASYYQSRSQQPVTPERQEVWHSIRLTNSTRVPWTTAPGETVKNGVILGQDTLTYTPPAARSTLRITQAVGLKAEQRELETARKQDALQLYGDHFDLITVRGELSVTSFQDKPVTMEITKMLSGELQTAEPQPQAEKLATGLRRTNPLLKLTWTLDLPPAQKRDLTYTYQLYVRR